MNKYGLTLASIAALLFFLACNYGVNEKTTQIAYINNRCLSKFGWDSIQAKYTVNNITDSAFLNALNDFKSVSFPVSLIYLSEEPAEIIGFDYSSIRYVFNPKIDSKILDGLSEELNEKEKKRIRKRVQKLLMEYQCEEGKQEARNLMDQ
jgi:hypothetical protein